MCKISTVAESKNTISVSKFCTSLQIMLENAVFMKNWHNWHKFYMTAVCNGQDKSKLCIIHPLIADWECVRRLDTLNFGGWSNRPLVEQVLLIKPISNLWIFKYREYSVFSFQYFPIWTFSKTMESGWRKDIQKKWKYKAFWDLSNLQNCCRRSGESENWNSESYLVEPTATTWAWRDLCRVCISETSSEHFHYLCFAVDANIANLCSKECFFSFSYQRFHLRASFSPFKTKRSSLRKIVLQFFLCSIFSSNLFFH